MPASTSGTKSPFCINTNRLFNFYHSAAPNTHICVYFSVATPATASTTAFASIEIINSTNQHLQHAKLRILLQHLTSHATYERSGGPPKRPAAKRPCIYKHIYLHTRALSGQHSDPCALSALEPFSAISPPLDLVSSRGLRPAIALSRGGLVRVRVRPCLLYTSPSPRD